MGCCCSSPQQEWNHHHPVLPEDRQLLSGHSSAAAVIPTGLIVDTNLDTSVPDTYRRPPAPMPYDAHPQGPPNNRDESVNKTHSPAHTNNSHPIGEPKVSNSVAAKEETGLEESEQLKKSNTPFVSPEECPTCLEEYDEENPKIITKCEHHFHLSCILEWMERSDTCPVCDQVMEVSFPIDN